MLQRCSVQFSSVQFSYSCIIVIGGKLSRGLLSVDIPKIFDGYAAVCDKMLTLSAESLALKLATFIQNTKNLAKNYTHLW